MLIFQWCPLPVTTQGQVHTLVWDLIRNLVLRGNIFQLKKLGHRVITNKSDLNVRWKHTLMCLCSDDDDVGVYGQLFPITAKRTQF